MSRINGTTAKPSPGKNPGLAPRFSLLEDDDERTDLVTQPHSHMPMSSFNVDIEDTGDDVLLDWERYSRAPTFTICGRQCTVNPPDWWYHLTKGQRRMLLWFAAGTMAFTVILVLMMLAAAARGYKSSNGAHIVENMCDWMEGRLPSKVRPAGYDLKFEVDMNAPWNVLGTSVVDLDVMKPTKCIVMHAKSMNVSKATLSGKEAARMRFNETLEQMTLEWSETIPKGSHELTVEFEYPLRDGMTGFYRSTYEENGKQMSLAATQFEAAAARTAFPCFDEPQFKAIFTVEVITNKEYQVLSNMPPRAVHHHEEQQDSVKTWHFESTPPMSSYLLAIIIGNLSSVSRQIDYPDESAWMSPSYWSLKKGTKRDITIWGIPSQVEHLEFAANATATILPFYEKSLGVAYSLPKLDLVAIPDFAAGAMENWGLVTYRQAALLVSPTSSIFDKRYVSKVIAHELAHQWFGDLITMKWWNDLWLNEGFATYFEYLGAEAAHSEYDFFRYFYYENLPQALSFDGKNTSHPLSLSYLPASSAYIESIFDNIEYQKGASVLRMLRMWMNREIESDSPPMNWEYTIAQQGPKADMFLGGLREYLIKHSFGSATKDELWQILGQSAGLELSPLMQEWSTKQGYPIVTVSMDAKGSVKLQQGKFSDQENDLVCDAENVWWIPVTYVSSDSVTQVKWGELNSCQSLRPLVTLPKGGWVKVNANQYGFYRVNYTDTLWDQLKIAAQAKDSKGYPILRAVDTAGLIEDSFHIAHQGGLGIHVFLDLFSTLRSRPVDEAGPWITALPYIMKINQAISCGKDWSSFVTNDVLVPFMTNNTSQGNKEAYLEQIFSFTGSLDEASDQSSIEIQMLRPIILNAAGYFGVKSVTEEAKLVFEEMNHNNRVGLNPDLRAAVYNTVARLNSNADFTLLVNLLDNANSADESSRVIRAMGHFQKPGIVLDLALQPLIRAQDIGILVESVAKYAGKGSAMTAFDWVVTNIEQLYTKLGKDIGASRRLGQILEAISENIYNEDAISKLESLYEKYPEMLAEHSFVLRSVESVRYNVNWKSAHNKEICTWLNSRKE